MEHIAVRADSVKAGRGNAYLGASEMERAVARSLLLGVSYRVSRLLLSVKGGSVLCFLLFRLVS